MGGLILYTGILSERIGFDLESENAMPLRQSQNAEPIGWIGGMPR